MNSSNGPADQLYCWVLVFQEGRVRIIEALQRRLSATHVEDIVKKAEAKEKKNQTKYQTKKTPKALKKNYGEKKVGIFLFIFWFRSA